MNDQQKRGLVAQVRRQIYHLDVPGQFPRLQTAVHVLPTEALRDLSLLLTAAENEIDRTGLHFLVRSTSAK